MGFLNDATTAVANAAAPALIPDPSLALGHNIQYRNPTHAPTLIEPNAPHIPHLIEPGFTQQPAPWHSPIQMGGWGTGPLGSQFGTPGMPLYQPTWNPHTGAPAMPSAPTIAPTPQAPQMPQMPNFTPPNVQPAADTRSVQSPQGALRSVSNPQSTQNASFSMNPNFMQSWFGNSPFQKTAGWGSGGSATWQR